MLKIGFIGCGDIARNHATRIKKLRNARIVAASDVVNATTRAFAADYGVEHCFDDYRKLLKLKEIDAVWVCTPTFKHAQPVIAAARAGKHVFCEKPMALKKSDATRMVEACQQADVLLTIGFVRRFDTFWGTFKRIIQSGAVGRPVVWRFAAGGKPPRPWFRDRNKVGAPSSTEPFTTTTLHCKSLALSHRCSRPLYNLMRRASAPTLRRPFSTSRAEISTHLSGLGALPQVHQ